MGKTNNGYNRYQYLLIGIFGEIGIAIGMLLNAKIGIGISKVQKLKIGIGKNR